MNLFVSFDLFRCYYLEFFHFCNQIFFYFPKCFSFLCQTLDIEFKMRWLEKLFFHVSASMSKFFCLFFQFHRSFNSMKPICVPIRHNDWTNETIPPNVFRYKSLHFKNTNCYSFFFLFSVQIDFTSLWMHRFTQFCWFHRQYLSEPSNQ